MSDDFDAAAFNPDMPSISAEPTSFASSSPKLPANVKKKDELVNAYVVMLLMALVAVVLGTVFLVFELGRYEWDTEARQVQWQPGVIGPQSTQRVV